MCDRLQVIGEGRGGGRKGEGGEELVGLVGQLNDKVRTKTTRVVRFWYVLVVR